MKTIVLVAALLVLLGTNGPVWAQDPSGESRFTPVRDELGKPVVDEFGYATMTDSNGEVVYMRPAETFTPPRDSKSERMVFFEEYPGLVKFIAAFVLYFGVGGGFITTLHYGVSGGAVGYSKTWIPTAGVATFGGFLVFLAIWYCFLDFPTGVFQMLGALLDVFLTFLGRALTFRA